MGIGRVIYCLGPNCARQRRVRDLAQPDSNANCNICHSDPYPGNGYANHRFKRNGGLWADHQRDRFGPDITITANRHDYADTIAAAATRDPNTIIHTRIY